MSYLLRVALPDVPGSLGRLASAIGSAGGNIDAIEIVERTHDGRAVDDVFLAANTGIMPDSIISACTSLPDVEVLWISRYGAGSNLTRDLEVVEAMTSDPDVARDTLVDLLPAGCSLNDDEMVVIARRGGPEILDSEIARLCHLVALAASISS